MPRSRYSEIVGEQPDLIGGLDEILGDELVGAQLARRSPGYSNFASHAVRSNPPTKGRELVLPIDSVTNVALSATQSIIARPQTLFRPERLVCGDVTNFLINDIRVGKNSQFVANGSIPSAAFGAGSFGVRLKMDTCQVAMDVVVNVTNTDGAAGHRFSAALFGASVE